MVEDTTFVLFGGTGDLAKNRILPAMALLYETGKVGKGSAVIAIGRKDFNDESFKAYVDIKNSIPIRYLRADIEGKDKLDKLPAIVAELGNKTIIHYLSISYRLFGNVTSQLQAMGLNKKPGYTIRIIYEKPFGHSLQSSIALDENVHQAFDEENVYRVDHYLGKETVQNLLVFRFSNPLFEAIWNSHFIEKITIIGDEDIGVSNRIAYYDESGAMKDMVQNHLLQLTSYVLMNSPISLEPNEIQNEKVKAIHNLYIKDKSDIVLGQYEGYQEEAKQIRPNSDTETYAALRVYSKDYRWRDMPIVISTGKMLTKRSAEIIIEFKKDQHILYPTAFNSPNRLIIRIQPMQELILEINNKKHGSGDVEPVLMTFSRDFGFSRKSPETYSKLIWECCLGSKIMFIRSDEVQEAWRLVDQALALKSTLIIYPKNTNPKVNFV